MRQAIFFLCLWSCSLLAGHAQEADEANYDESKIPPYTLPALLKTSDGREITTVQQWEQIRRPELLSVFTEQVYGKMPADKVDVSYKKLAVGIPLQLYGLQVSNGHGGTALSRNRLFFCG